jgi:hypothetical protein
MAWVQVDAAAAPNIGAQGLADRPLWPDDVPAWANTIECEGALRAYGDWDVWADWYEQRLRGGTRGEAYELVFASVPEEEWDKSSAAANAWIKANLPK